MTAQHTPGPYRITPAFNRKHVFFVAAEITDEPLAQVYSLKNARLFAAAPLLLAALEFAAAPSSSQTRRRRDPLRVVARRADRHCTSHRRDR